MTWVKICGMTNLEDALIAVEAGGDAGGFVFYEKSPGNVSGEAAREIGEKLPESVGRVGGCVGGTGVGGGGGEGVGWGGRAAGHVGDGMEILKAWGVDVSFGVEGRAGKKDREKVGAFVKAVRDAERKS